MTNACIQGRFSQGISKTESDPRHQDDPTLTIQIYNINTVDTSSYHGWYGLETPAKDPDRAFETACTAIKGDQTVSYSLSSNYF